MLSPDQLAWMPNLTGLLFAIAALFAFAAAGVAAREIAADQRRRVPAYARRGTSFHGLPARRDSPIGRKDRPWR